MKLKKIEKLIQAALLVGIATLLLLLIMETEIHFSPFYLKIHNAEKLLETFIQICAFMLFYWIGVVNGFNQVLELLRKEEEKRETEGKGDWDNVNK